MSNFCVNVLPPPSDCESQTPVSDVVVCVVPSLLPNVTVVPVGTVNGVGMNPDAAPVDAPVGMSTVVGDAGIGVVTGLGTVVGFPLL